MGKSSKEESIKVKMSTLKAINRPIVSYLYRLDSLLKDHYSGKYTLRDDLLLSLFEMRLSSQILNERLRELEEQSIDAEVTDVYLPAQEVQLIATLAHTLELGVLTNINNISLREH
jgi:hypothetical protein